MVCPSCQRKVFTRRDILGSTLHGTARCPSCGQTARLDVASRWMIATLLAILLPNALLYGNFFYSGHLFVTSIFIILGAWGGLSWICFPVLSLERVATHSAIDRSKGLLILGILFVAAVVIDGIMRSRFE